MAASIVRLRSPNSGSLEFGGPDFHIIAGPCSIETETQFVSTAHAVKDAGASLLRGGLYKLRTNPESFQGLGGEAATLVQKVARSTGLPIVTEVTDPRQIEALSSVVDVFQVGTRNMYNYALLKELGLSKKPVLLKRAFSATLDEWILAARYITREGNHSVIFCERGIRTFEKALRNTLDLSAVPYVKSRTEFPIIVDPSHATGDRAFVEPMALAAVAAGADGLLIEVHPRPAEALSDGPQALNFESFAALARRVDALCRHFGRRLAGGEGSTTPDAGASQSPGAPPWSPPWSRDLVTTPSSTYKGPDPDRIRGMFSSIAEGYDRANSVLSVGIHHRWRRALVVWSGARTGQSVLDCATGTGDLAIAFKKAVGAKGSVLGTDFCQEMLASAPAKAAAEGLDIAFEVADVTKLPYAEARFDIASIAFGIRNVQDPRQAVRELHRVLRPGGTLMILEFGQPQNAALRAAYGFYSKRVLPWLGGLVTGRRDAYQYLEESSSRFPCREDFVALMRESAIFSSIKYRALSFGIAYIYKAVKA